MGFFVGQDKGPALYPNLARRAFLASLMLNLRSPFQSLRRQIGGIL
jgi:hypothetical protein